MSGSTPGTFAYQIKQIINGQKFGNMSVDEFAAFVNHCADTLIEPFRTLLGSSEFRIIRREAESDTRTDSPEAIFFMWLWKELHSRDRMLRFVEVTNKLLASPENECVLATINLFLEMRDSVDNIASIYPRLNGHLETDRQKSFFSALWSKLVAVTDVFVAFVPWQKTMLIIGQAGNVKTLFSDHFEYSAVEQFKELFIRMRNSVSNDIELLHKILVVYFDGRR